MLIEITEVQRIYLESLVASDVVNIASDIASAQASKLPNDERHLRLAHAEASVVYALLMIPPREAGM